MAQYFDPQKFANIKNVSHIDPFAIGDSVVVETKIQEGDKTRIQKFKGIVIRIANSKENKTFTVRHIGPGGIGVERTWPFISPWIQKVTVEKRGKVRRAKLYYLRSRKGKAAKVIKAKVEAKNATA